MTTSKLIESIVAAAQASPSLASTFVGGFWKSRPHEAAGYPYACFETVTAPRDAGYSVASAEASIQVAVYALTDAVASAAMTELVDWLDILAPSLRPSNMAVHHWDRDGVPFGMQAPDDPTEESIWGQFVTYSFGIS